MDSLGIAIVGLGRLGKRYADIIRYQLLQAELKAACSIVPEELTYAREKLELDDVYDSVEEMLIRIRPAVVFVVSSTDQHATHMIQALEAGCHVFSEKPLSISVEECERVEAVAESFPGQLAMVGFNRRFDPSYVYARNQIDKGLIGKPFRVHSQTVDKDTVADSSFSMLRTAVVFFTTSMCTILTWSAGSWIVK